jgi:hypothetical protein
MRHDLNYLESTHIFNPYSVRTSAKEGFAYRRFLAVSCSKLYNRTCAFEFFSIVCRDKPCHDPREQFSMEKTGLKRAKSCPWYVACLVKT